MCRWVEKKYKTPGCDIYHSARFHEMPDYLSLGAKRRRLMAMWKALADAERRHYEEQAKGEDELAEEAQAEVVREMKVSEPKRG